MRIHYTFHTIPCLPDLAVALLATLMSGTKLNAAEKAQLCHLNNEERKSIEGARKAMLRVGRAWPELILIVLLVVIL